MKDAGNLILVANEFSFIVNDELSMVNGQSAARKYKLKAVSKKLKAIQMQDYT
jgi:hypothetical protein